MFEALNVATQLVKALAPIVPLIQRRDPALAGQIKRAATSVASCFAEGAARDGRDRLHLYRVAGGSAKEVVVQVDVAVAWGYVDAAAAASARALADRAAGIAWGLTHRR